MNVGNITLQKIDGIYDIQPLIQPASSFLEISLLTIFILLFITIHLYIIWNVFYSRKAIAKRKIKKLYLTYTQQRISSHNAVYYFCDLMKKGLKLKQLSSDTLLPDSINQHKTKWINFIDKTSQLRYKKNSSNIEDIEDIDALFLEGINWLKIWP